MHLGNFGGGHAYFPRAEGTAAWEVRGKTCFGVSSLAFYFVLDESCSLIFVMIDYSRAARELE
jgi:hypothetical protein